MKTLILTVVLACGMSAQNVQTLAGCLDGRVPNSKGECPQGTLIMTTEQPAFAHLERGKCSICKKEGKRSRIDMISNSTVLAVYHAPPYYDEDGNYHAYEAPPQPVANCSRGHLFLELLDSERPITINAVKGRIE